MKTAGLVLGVVVMLGMLLSFLPLLDWMNWGIIPLAVIGLVISIIAAVKTTEHRSTAIAGILLCTIAVSCCSIRLIMSGGIY